MISCFHVGNIWYSLIKKFRFTAAWNLWKENLFLMFTITTLSNTDGSFLPNILIISLNEFSVLVAAAVRSFQVILLFW